MPGSDCIMQVYIYLHLKLTFLGSGQKLLYKAGIFFIILKSDKLEHLKNPLHCIYKRELVKSMSQELEIYFKSTVNKI